MEVIFMYLDQYYLLISKQEIINVNLEFLQAVSK